MAERLQDTSVEASQPNVAPTQMSESAGRHKAIIDTVREELREPKEHIRDVRTEVAKTREEIGKIRDDRYSELKWIVLTVAGAGIIIFGALLAAYFKIDSKIDALSVKFDTAVSKLDDKINTLNTGSARTETKLDDLISRIPPVQTPVKTK